MDIDNEAWRWFWSVLAVILATGEIFSPGFFLLPFGIGAAVGGTANWALSRALTSQTRRFFDGYHLLVPPPPPPSLSPPPSINGSTLPPSIEAGRPPHVE